MKRIYEDYRWNNSSAYRLIARFSDAASAAAAALELRTFFHEHAGYVDAKDDPVDPSEAATALASKVGFVWTHVLGWGLAGLTDDEPTVATVDRTLAIYHPCCGGFGDLVKYFEARGVPYVHERGAPSLSLLLRWPAEPGELTEQWERIAAYHGDTGEPIAGWWGGRACYGPVAAIRDNDTACLACPIDPDALVLLRSWLTARGLTAAIALGEDSDRLMFERVARSRCTACGGHLSYLDPRIHDIDAPQLLCKRCGGLYEPGVFT